MHPSIENRRSIRKFTTNQVTKGQLIKLVEAAMYAPSAKNLRPWEFVIITNRAVLDKISEISPSFHMFKSATAGIIVVGLEFEDMPVGYFQQCCGAATQNILLEATNQGLGTCWCGVYPRQERVKPLQELLNINKLPFCAIAIGVPDEAPAKRGHFEDDKITYID